MIFLCITVNGAIVHEKGNYSNIIALWAVFSGVGDCISEIIEFENGVQVILDILSK